MKKVNLNKFDSIIFDFGGVICDIDPNRTIQAFSTLYGKQKFEKVLHSGFLWEFEKGKINAIELQEGVEEMTSVNIDADVFKRAWNSTIVNYKSKRIERIQLLKHTHQLFLLSNTNEYHYAYFSNKLIKEYSVSLNELFTKIYISNEMGLLKPDLDIYRQVLIEQQLNPEKTLFIEDTKDNADAAEKLGIQTLVIPRNGSFYKFFE